MRFRIRDCTRYELTLNARIKPGEQEERDHEQRRHHADEHVREDQLAADAPEQPPLRPHRKAREAVRDREQQREAADHVDRFERGRQRDEETERPGDGLDGGAEDERAARERCAATTSATRATATACRRAAAQRDEPGRSSGAYQSILFNGPYETQRRRALQHDLHSRRTGARSGDRRHHHADLSDLDLRAGRPRPAACRLRIRPHAEPDAHGARAQRRRDRSGHRRVRICVGHGGDRCAADAARIRRSRAGQRQHLWRHVPAVRAGAPQVRARFHLRRHLEAGARRAGDQAEHEIPVHRDADQPDAAHHRHPVRERASRTARTSASSSTTRLPARTSSAR